MKKKKIVIETNYLERKPAHHPDIRWTKSADGKVILEVDNVGWANRIAQKLLKKPKISHIHLDEMGSFVWPLVDGKRTIIQIGDYVKEHFGEKAEPLYERLVQYFKILEDNGFINWN